jgi:hypothetical protein
VVVSGLGAGRSVVVSTGSIALLVVSVPTGTAVFVVVSTTGGGTSLVVSVPTGGRSVLVVVPTGSTASLVVAVSVPAGGGASVLAPGVPTTLVSVPAGGIQFDVVCSSVVVGIGFTTGASVLLNTSTIADVSVPTGAISALVVASTIWPIVVGVSITGAALVVVSTTIASLLDEVSVFITTTSELVVGRTSMGATALVVVEMKESVVVVSVLTSRSLSW